MNKVCQFIFYRQKAGKICRDWISPYKFLAKCLYDTMLCDVLNYAREVNILT